MPGPLVVCDQSVCCALTDNFGNEDQPSSKANWDSVETMPANVRTAIGATAGKHPGNRR